MSDYSCSFKPWENQAYQRLRKELRTIYSLYYPAGAVQFWVDLHSKAKIEEVMAAEEIYFAAAHGEIVGTGSIQKNEICRQFVLPEYQGKGHGSRLIFIGKRF